MKTIKLSILKKSDLKHLAKFVVEENLSHHVEKPAHNQAFIEKEIEYIYEEESKFSNSKVLVATNSENKIIGSIRTLKWNTLDILPIEKMFAIDLKNILETKKTDIWHIGRFAIKKGAEGSGFSLFKTLMVHAINDVCTNTNSLAIAECDVKLLRILKALGIETTAITNSIHYLGSETVPVILTYKTLKNFLDYNLHFLSCHEENLHKSVVLSTPHQYYTFV
ncbi:hypothetical protein [Chryseobacterium shigense]|uniref:N-acyl-L-homoserine lactone synthetase n=1 Tax=Chryseobacterium shigense TaxID=297244 RepID=A0A841NDG2_9FLAO|nr:hypothetical protein [Chryseobacterium shigense]MBB6371360.1 N-acyl-L-homoserine lactone synthetase [Chryseobacterium shigense]